MTHCNTGHSDPQYTKVKLVQYVSVCVSVTVFAYTLTFICIKVLLRRGLMTHHLHSFYLTVTEIISVAVVEVLISLIFVLSKKRKKKILFLLA